jgi:glycosyltransferase involved in cell wall biosynthesis
MRVLFVIPGQETGSSMIFARRQIDSLKKQGMDSFTFYLESRLNPVKLISEFLRFRKTVKSFNPEIVHCHYGTMSAFFSAFSNLKPLVITYHGSDLNFLKSENFFLEVFRKILSQLAALRAAAIICVSEKLKWKLLWKKNIVSVIPMGIDEDFFRPVNYADAETN